MSTNNLERKHLKVFGESTTDKGQFGSAQAGTKLTSNDPETLQDLTAFENGWSDAVISGKRLPPLEEMNSLHFIATYHLAYLMQKGLPEWNAETTYFTGDWARSGDTLYKSLTDDNLNNVVTDETNWKLLKDFGEIENPKMIEGFGFSTPNPTDFTNFPVTFDGGQCYDSTGTFLIEHTGNMTKYQYNSGSGLFLEWTEGDLGGAFLGALPAPPEYHVTLHHFVISKADGSTDFAISRSENISTLLPTDYVYFRRIFSFVSHEVNRPVTYSARGVVEGRHKGLDIQPITVQLLSSSGGPSRLYDIKSNTSGGVLFDQVVKTGIPVLENVEALMAVIGYMGYCSAGSGYYSMTYARKSIYDLDPTDFDGRGSTYVPDVASATSEEVYTWLTAPADPEAVIGIGSFGTFAYLYMALREFYDDRNEIPAS